MDELERERYPHYAYRMKLWAPMARWSPWFVSGASRQDLICMPPPSPIYGLLSLISGRPLTYKEVALAYILDYEATMDLSEKVRKVGEETVEAITSSKVMVNVELTIYFLATKYLLHMASAPYFGDRQFPAYFMELPTKTVRLESVHSGEMRGTLLPYPRFCLQEHQPQCMTVCMNGGAEVEFADYFYSIPPTESLKIQNQGQLYLDPETGVVFHLYGGTNYYNGFDIMKARERLREVPETVSVTS